MKAGDLVTWLDAPVVPQPMPNPYVPPPQATSEQEDGEAQRRALWAKTKLGRGHW